MTSWVTDEFCLYPESNTNSYYSSGLFLRLLAEVIGPDPFLHAYLDGNMGAINDALLEIIPDQKVLSNLYTQLDRTDRYFKLLQITSSFGLWDSSIHTFL